jgi:integrase
MLELPAPSEEPVRWLTAEEAERLIEACNKDFRPFVIFLLHTGARVGEALWLDWRHLDLTRGHVSVSKTKNGEARGVPLHLRMIAALANLPRRAGKVFRRNDGLPYERPDARDEGHVSADSRVSTTFARACRRAKSTDFYPHDCRHTWATWHYAANCDLGSLRRLDGWKLVRMAVRYAHANVDELRDTIDRLPGGKPGGRAISAGRKVHERQCDRQCFQPLW